jgi:hypothetical protein
LWCIPGYGAGAIALRAIGYPVVPMPVPVGRSARVPAAFLPQIPALCDSYCASARSSAWLGIGARTLNGD